MARTKEFNESVVLDKAMLTFWEQGYEKTSMQDLVDNMGIHRRSIYDTFGDKHALFMKALDQYETELEQEISQRLKPTMSTKEKLEELFSIVIQKNSNHPKGCLIVNTATELALLDSEVTEKVQGAFSKSENYIFQLLSEAQKNDIALKEQNLHELASYLHNAWVGIRVLAKTTNDQKKLRSIVKVTLSIL